MGGSEVSDAQEEYLLPNERIHARHILAEMAERCRQARDAVDLNSNLPHVRRAGFRVDVEKITGPLLWFSSTLLPSHKEKARSGARAAIAKALDAGVTPREIQMLMREAYTQLVERQLPVDPLPEDPH